VFSGLKYKQNRNTQKKSLLLISHFLCVLLIPLNYKKTEGKENSQQQQIKSISIKNDDEKTNNNKNEIHCSFE